MAAMYDQLGNYIGDDGLDAEIRPFNKTQATSPPVPPGVNNGAAKKIKPVPILGAGFGTGVSEFGDDPPVSPTDAGVGATDDGTTQGIQEAITNQATVNSATTVNANAVNEQITPKPNILDTFSSYTYRASVYMMSPAQYRALVLSNKKTINGYQLLFQSAGAPNNVGGFKGGLAEGAESMAASLRGAEATQSEIATALTRGIPGSNSPDAGRNPAFPMDFYIDSVTIENLLSGQGTRAAHAVTNLKFTVVEPMGITLIDRIYQAAQDFIPKNGAGAINYNSVSYLMVIRFYGYDAQGNLVPGIRGADASSSLSDQSAVVEKFIPFRLSKVNFAITDKLVTYEFEGKAFNAMIAAGTRRGTIPYDVQLNAGSLGDLLGSEVEYISAQKTTSDSDRSTPKNDEQRRLALAHQAAIASGNAASSPGSNTPPAKANAAPSAKKTVKKGLMGAMNDYQKVLCEGPNADFTVPDTYKIVWVADSNGKQPIRDATIVLPGAIKESAQTGYAPPATQSPGSVDPTRVSKNTTTKNFAITAGMQLVQVIDLAIRNSSYIIDQQLVIRNTQTGKEEPNNEKNGQPVKWYNIMFEALPKEYDDTRNDTAFDITFYIVPYIIERYDSRYFPLTKFRGVHKSYNVFFTGQNTGVIDYKEEINSLYNITVSGSDPQNSAAERQRRSRTSSMRDMPFYASHPGSTESRQGTAGQALEPAANLTESFYSPADLAKTTLKIIGDPAWVQQGSFAGGVNPESFNWGPFLPDGTINYDTMQVLFEVAWQRPEDYDLQTGLANPYNRATAQNGQPGASRIYVAKKCVSEFRQGKFEQTIEGSLFTFPIPTSKNKAATAAVTNTDDQSAAETARLQRQNDVLGRANASNPQTALTSGATPANQTDGAQYGSGGTTALSAPVATQLSTNQSSSPPVSTAAGAPQPTLPPKPATTNGVEVAVNMFSPPGKITAGDIRNIENAIAQGQNQAAFGVFRSPRRSNPQLIARDE